MTRISGLVLAVLLGLAGSAQAASQLNSLPSVTFPLPDPGNPSTSTENIWISNGSAANTDFRITPTQLGYQFQGALAPTTPFAQQFWWNTTTAAAPIHSIYTGSVWVPAGTLDKTNGIWVPPVGGGVATVAGSGTTDLGSVPQASVTISGSATISSFGSSAVIGTIKFLTFSGASALTYNASSMILPGAASITAAANDTAVAQYLGGGNWRVNVFSRASGSGAINLPTANLLGGASGNFTVVTVGTGLALGGGTLTAAPPSATLLGGTGTAFTSVAVGAGLTFSAGTLSDNPNNTSTSSPVSSLNALYFPTYSQLAGYGFKLALTGSISDASGSFRDTVYFENTDSDITGYAASHSNYAGRFAAFGPYSAGWLAGRKNIIGLSTYAKGATSSAALGDGSIPGIGGISVEAIQYGTGLASNKFAAHNPSAAGGSIGQSVSIAAVQGIVDQSYADVDTSHTAYAFLATNTGAQLATAAYGASGATQYQTFLDAGTAVVKVQAIIMPGSATAAYEGTVINYGLHNGNPAGGSWTDWIGTTNGGQYRWVDGGVVIATMDTTGVSAKPAAGSNGFGAVPVSGAGNTAYVATGSWANGIDLSSATIANAGIVLGTTTAKSAILYDVNNFSRHNSGTYEIFVGGSLRSSISAAGLTTLSTLAAGATTLSSLSVTPSVASLASLVVGQASPLAADACTAGQIVADTGFIYACTASGVWKRVAIVGGY